MKQLKTIKLLVAFLLLAACEPQKPYNWLYSAGDKVVLKTGEKGVIIRRAFVPYYWIRVVPIVGTISEEGMIEEVLVQGLDK